MSKKYIKNCTGNLPKETKIGKFSAFVSRFIFNVLFLSFLCVSAYVLFFSEYLAITDISISGESDLREKDMLEALESEIGGKFLDIIPNNNFLFFPESRIENILLKRFKKIRTAEAEKKFPNKISIEIDEHKALMVWCSNGKCFLLDENGVAYNEADFESPELKENNLIKIDDGSGQSIDIGENVTDPSYENYAISIKSEFKKLDFDVEEYRTPSRIAQEIDVKTKQGVEIYLSTEFPLDSAMRALLIVLEKEIPRDQKEKLAYVDLRSENKVFYKFKGEEGENTEPKDGQENLEE